MRIKFTISFILFMMVTISANGLQASLPSQLLIIDDMGLHIKKDGIYFIDARNMRPGSKITKTLTIRNFNEMNLVTLYMKARPLKTEGPVNLLDKIKLELKLGKTTIYSGRLYGDEGIDMVTDSLALGEYEYGDSRILSISITLEPNIPKELFYGKSKAAIRWEFTAIQKETLPPPITGERLTGLYMLFGAIIGSVILLIVVKNKTKRTI